MHLIAPTVFGSVLGIVAITVCVADLCARVTEYRRKKAEFDMLAINL